MRSRAEVAYLYSDYRAWCQNRSFDALSIDAFGDAVIEGAEIEAVRSRRRVYLLGLKLVNEVRKALTSSPLLLLGRLTTLRALATLGIGFPANFVDVVIDFVPDSATQYPSSRSPCAHTHRSTTSHQAPEAFTPGPCCMASVAMLTPTPPSTQHLAESRATN